MRQRGGGGLLCCSFSVNWNGLLICLSLPPSGVFCSLFSLCFCCFFAIRSSVCFVYCSSVRCLLPCSGFFSCCSWPLRLSATSSFSLVVVRFSCVSFLSLGVVYSFGGLPCLLHPSLLLVVLTSSLLRLLILSFVAVGSDMLSSPLCSPFFAMMALPCASSGFPVFTCSVLLPLSFNVLFLVCLFA